MGRVFEAPKSGSEIRRLREKAARSEHFCQLVIAMRELAIEHCVSDHQMRQAMRLAMHEQAWSSYRLMQGIEPAVQVEELIDEEEEDEDGGVL